LLLEPCQKLISLLFQFFILGNELVLNLNFVLLFGIEVVLIRVEDLKLLVLLLQLPELEVFLLDLRMEVFYCFLKVGELLVGTLGKLKLIHSLIAYLYSFFPCSRVSS
jgi:hypothetical protein